MPLGLSLPHQLFQFCERLPWGSRKPGRFLFWNQPRPWLHWHNALCPLAGNPGSSGPQLWPAATPGPRGSLPSACPHGPCDGELATWPQAPLTLTGSGASTPQGPAVGDSRNATRWLWAGDLSFCSFKWAEKPSCLPDGATVRNTPFSLPCLDKLGAGGQVGGVSHILHSWCHCSQQSLTWSQTGFHRDDMSDVSVLPGEHRAPQRCLS